MKSTFFSLALLGFLGVTLTGFASSQAEPPSEKPATEVAPDVPKAAVRTLEQKFQTALQLLKTGEEKLSSSSKAFSCILYVKEDRGEEAPEETYVLVNVRRQPLRIYGYVARSATFQGQAYFYDSARKKDQESFILPRKPHEQYVKDIFGSPRRLKMAHLAPTAIGQRFAERMKAHVTQPQAEIKFSESAKINGRPMQMIQLSFSEPGPDQLFRIARLFLDVETGLPSRYEAWDWPTDGAQENRLIEEFTFYEIKPIEEQEVEEYRF